MSSSTQLLRIPLLVFALALPRLGTAASSIVDLETEYSGPLTPTINTSDSQNHNLSDLSGLTPGQTIQLQFVPSDPVIWSGSLFYPEGDLSLTWTATIEIAVGSHVFTFTDTWSLIAPDAPESGVGGVHAAGMPGPAPTIHSWDLPWGTDLSNITITLKDLSTFSGGDFAASSMHIHGTLRTVPEPSALLLSAGALPLALLRRRPRAHR